MSGVPPFDQSPTVFEEEEGYKLSSRKMAELYHWNRHLRQATSLEEVGELVGGPLTDLIDADRGFFLVPISGRYLAYGDPNLPSTRPSRIFGKPGEAVPQWLFEHFDIVSLSKGRAIQGQWKSLHYCAVPVLIGNRLPGFIAMGREIGHGWPFDDEELMILELAASLVAAILRPLLEAKEPQDLPVLRRELLSAVAHELRTPLTTLKGFLALVEDESLELTEDERRGFCDVMRASLSDLSSVVDQILLVQLLRQAQDRDACCPPVDIRLPELMDEVLRSLEHHMLEHEVRVRISYEGVDSLHGYTDVLRMLIRNLIASSVEESLPGSHVLARFERRDEGICLEVRDTGTLDLKKTLRWIVDPKFPPQALGKTGSAGKGFGLYIAKALTELMGGTLRIASQAGMGTRVSAYLPQKGGASLEGRRPETGGQPEGQDEADPGGR